MVSKAVPIVIFNGSPFTKRTMPVIIGSNSPASIIKPNAEAPMWMKGQKGDRLDTSLTNTEPYEPSEDELPLKEMVQKNER